MLYLAKQNIKLSEHSNRVANYAVAIAEQTLKENHFLEYKEAIKLAALLHDIGKITSNFQRLLVIDSYEEINKKNKFRHNEIGWALVSKYLKHKYSKLISSTIYWHHGISNKMSVNFLDEILDSLNEGDEENMLKYLTEVVGEECIKNPNKLVKKTPSYFENGENAEEENNLSLILRKCIISADRIISKLENDIIFGLNIEDLDNIINSKLPDSKLYINTYNNKNNIVITTPYNNDRFTTQKEITELLTKTTILNGPAGFGKTIVAILSAIKSKKKLIWVCPRNSIANSVYDRVESELKALGIYGIKTELYLTGNVEKSNHDATGFDSDIIVTNIDNYLKPMIDNSSMDRLYSIIDCDVVFDEYDEFISEAALFAGFINIMQVRHRYTDSKTLLLSATYQNLECYWDNNEKTSILPGKYKHYSAAHNKKFLLKIKNETELDLSGSNKLLVVNSIRLGQEFHKNNKNNTLLIHSELEDKRKEEIFKQVLNLYGKNNNLIEKLNVIGTHIIQTSFDISFKNVMESIISPSATLQRAGRNNRWGEYDDYAAELIIFKFNNKSEIKMCDILYDHNLTIKWYEYISKYNNMHLTLDTLYEIYNEFHKINQKEIDKFISKRYNGSFTFLEGIYPIKYNISNIKSNIKSAGSNKLRYTTDEVFVIAQKFGNKGYSNPFTVKLYDNNFSKTFKETERGIDFNKIKKVMESLKDDDRFDYSDIIDNKKIGLEDFQKRFSKKSNTPYIRFDKIYHDDYGFIYREFLLNNN